MKQRVSTYLAVCIAFSFIASTQAQQNSEEKAIEVIHIFADQSSLDTASGSGAVLDQQQLDNFEFDDIHRVLASVAGVYIREEDGFGLRPNIGLRGANSERSSKVALMEDGILLAPAPYSAPAAYFFPLMSRIAQVEVFKGPSAIAYGPNTVGGAINLLSRPISAEPAGYVDVAVGQQGYRKLHGYYSSQIDDLGLLVEGINLKSDGFKHFPQGGNTGFDKREWLSKFSYTPSNDKWSQHWQFSFAYADEVSFATYMGLSDQDFAIDPYLRYAASKDDKMEWDHISGSIAHYIELKPNVTLFTQVYRRNFDRAWDRMNGFDSNLSLSSIFSSPDTAANSLLMQVLRGERDSQSEDETLIFALNHRNYYSQGIQTKLLWDTQWQDWQINIQSGLRLHQDRIKRLHRARETLMRSQQLQRLGSIDRISTNNRQQVSAVAAYSRIDASKDNWYLNAGIRVESIDGEAQNALKNTSSDNSDVVVLPGIGVFYQLNQNIGLLGGVNKGFVPNSPGQASDIDPEESWNYEFGMRANHTNWRADVIGFYNDYSNLKGTCTFSSGCNLQIAQEFNGGEVDISGIEVAMRGEFALSDSVNLPMSLSYTYTNSEFQNSFRSEFVQWGTVKKGDELPYLPKQQLSIQLGLAHELWQVQLLYKYVGEMSEAVGTDTELSGVRTPKRGQFDLTGWYEVKPKLKLYVKVDNLLNEQEIVSRRPFGARPAKQRQFMLGIKYRL